MAGQGGPVMSGGSGGISEVLRLLGVRVPPPTQGLPPIPDTVGPGTPGYDPTTLANRIKNPSVMEPWWMKGLRAGTDVAERAIDTGTGALLGPDSSGTSNRNMGALLSAIAPVAIARVPREATQQLLQRLSQSWGEGAPPALERALETLSQRFPRMLSHIEGVAPLPPGTASDTMGVFRAAEDGAPRVGKILLHPTLSEESMLDTLTHELTHGGQALRAADRGMEFQPLYASRRQQHGYYNNPFEVQARIAEQNQALRRADILPDPRERLDTARMWAGDKTLQHLPGERPVDPGAIARLEQGLPTLQAPASALDIVPADPNTFAAGISTLNRRARANTSVYTPEELSQMQLYMVNGANAGYAIKGGDELVNVFNNGGFATFGRAREIIDDAVRRGARRLDCFDGKLVDLYESAGFRVVRREPNWTPGGPDIVFMEWVGGPTAASAAAR